MYNGPATTLRMTNSENRSPLNSRGRDGDSDAGTDTPNRDDTTEWVVSKALFCHQCRFFADPPASRCTHDQSSIVAFLDMDQVRVSACPIARREHEPDHPTDPTHSTSNQ